MYSDEYKAQMRIKHLWDVLGRRVRTHNPPAATIQELFELLQQEWQAIPQDTLRRLVQSMRRRCVACWNMHGGHTAIEIFYTLTNFLVTFGFGGIPFHVPVTQTILFY
eukprot:TRINITY_DN1151_c0_g1_i11.p1 TRINITY_DN1151_c0_g1~~TRINITY_DN1151_c0_g1_i11.p1  ORF type:complete len:108 (-),score=8.03 TRINITY_DN1151_c0_g1_i11:190-513(-)